MSAHADRRGRIGRIIGGVVRQALVDAGAGGVCLRDAAAPESPLAFDWCAAAIGEARVRGSSGDQGWLVAASASKTTLLLTRVAPAGLLPLGDLYGSELLELGGRWDPPGQIRELAAAAGGPLLLDAALRRWAEERRPAADAFAPLPPGVAGELLRTLEANRWLRHRYGLIPKLTGRTLGIDLWE